jgi:hypothetical protein
MMSKFIFFMLALVLIPFACAEEVKLDNIKGYVNNERVSDVDEDGGDFEVVPDDELELVVYVDNQDNETIEVRLRAIIENIDDGDDLEEEQDWYDVDAKDDRAKTLSFIIPDDAERDTYDMELNVYYRYDNGTQYEFTRDFDIEVIEDRVEEEHVDYDGMLTNLSSSCNSLVSTADACFGYIDKHIECSSELSTIKEERGNLNQQVNDLQSQMTECESQKTEAISEKNIAESKVNGMLTYAQCNATVTAAEARARNDASKNSTNTLLIVGLGIAGVWYYQHKKKSKATVTDAYYYDKT